MTLMRRPRLRMPVSSRLPPLDQPQLELAVDAQGTPARVVVRGGVDLATAAQLREVLHEVATRRVDVVLDCTAMTSIDACGLGVLVAASRRMGAQGHVLALAGPSPFLRLVLHRTGLGHVLPVEGQCPLPPQRSPPQDGGSAPVRPTYPLLEEKP